MHLHGDIVICIEVLVFHDYITKHDIFSNTNRSARISLSLCHPAQTNHSRSSIVQMLKIVVKSVKYLHHMLQCKIRWI